MRTMTMFIEVVGPDDQRPWSIGDGPGGSGDRALREPGVYMTVHFDSVHAFTGVLDSPQEFMEMVEGFELSDHRTAANATSLTVTDWWDSALKELRQNVQDNLSDAVETLAKRKAELDKWGR